MPSDNTPVALHKVKKGLGLVAVLAIAFAVFGIISRKASDVRLEQWTQAQAIPTVKVISPKRGSSGQELVLPGDVQAYFEAPIHARVSGYVKMWYHDIGARVRDGEVLASIDTPELDQQLEQAKHELLKAEARLQLAKLTSKRWQALRASVAVSQQSADEKAGDVDAKAAEVAAARANVERLKAFEGFKQIVAPFAGVVTARKVDVGALVQGANDNGQELFSVADIHQMRVYVSAPQIFASQLRPGMKAAVRLPQYPKRSFEAKLATTSNAISQKSRTLLVELLADNPDGMLWPGSYAEVHFKLPDNPQALRAPASALLFRGDHVKLATLGTDDKVVLKRIEIDRDLGSEVEIASGIDPSERIIDNPSDSISDGDVVRIAGSDEEHPTTAAGQENRGVE